MRPNHHQFVAFAYVVREGSFSAAAARLGVTQSTITQHVAKLEQKVGAQLLIRGRDGVEVTATGQDFYDLADRLVALDSTIEERLQGFASMRAGRIKVIANAPQPALEVIGRFTGRFPELSVDFALHDWTTANTMIRNRLADVGIVTDPPRRDDWNMHKIQTTGYVAYCPEGWEISTRARLSMRDLLAHTVILPEEGSLTRRVVNAKLRELGLSIQREVSMRSFPLMCEAVLQGIGVAIFLRGSSQISKGLVEVPLEEFETTHETWLVVPKDRAKLRLISEFTSTALSVAL
ncbi:MAG: LysR family transcriptional regulator [Roseovarius sp.]